MGIILALCAVVVDVAQFWHEKFRKWCLRKSPVELWLHLLRNADVFEDWEEAALHLDNLLGLDLWRNNATSKYYDYRLINERLESLATAREEGNLHHVVNLLRSGLVRNLGNITAPKLYNRSFAGTKYLIEEYITQVAEAIEDINALPTSPSSYPSALVYRSSSSSRTSKGDNGGISSSSRSSSSSAINNIINNSSSSSINNGRAGIGPVMTTQTKLDLIHDTRQAFGRSTLVLQGGAIFGMCHLGVVKALFLRGLLPRIITGTATGAIIAALVAIHTEEELPAVLKGDGIDLSAFATAFAGAQPGNDDDDDKGPESQSLYTRWETLLRRVSRFRREGYFLDVRVLEECVRANVGDLTFEEAYNRSKRVLNITVATVGQGGIPTLLNYLTAPNVLIWTAAVASNASPSLYGDRSTTVLCKDANGNLVPWASANTVFHHWSLASYSDRESPLTRISELFNVNHFIVSQARPYLIPFLQSDMHGPSLLETRSKTTQATAFLVRMVGLELRHRLRQLDTLQLLPAGIRRFLVDERVPAATASVMLVPEVTPGDFVRLLETPTRETLDYWILKGERSVWPAVAALRIRCAIENELDRSYQLTRRLRAGGLRRK